MKSLLLFVFFITIFYVTKVTSIPLLINNETVSSFETSPNGVMNDSYSRPIQLCERFLYSIRSVSSGLYQHMSASSQQLLGSELDPSDISYFARFYNGRNNTYDYYFLANHSPELGLSGHHIYYVGILGADLSSQHPYYDNYIIVKSLQTEGWDNIKFLIANDNSTFSFCSICSGEYGPKAKWVLELHPDIKLFGKLTDFKFNLTEKDILNKKTRRVGYESIIVENSGTVEITREINRKYYTKDIKQLTFNGSLNAAYNRFNNITVDYRLELMYNNITFNFNEKSIYTKTDEKSLTMPETIYHETQIKERVVVPPNNKIKVDSYVNWVDGIEIPFTAILYVNGADVSTSQYIPSGFQKFPMYWDKIQRLLSTYGILNDVYVIDDHLVGVKVSGTLTGSYSLGSNIETSNL